jgi:hypothetical protein
MTANLFPIFNAPPVLADIEPTIQRYNPAPLWNLERGDFILDGARKMQYGSGFDAWVLWCVKTVLTQRWAHDGYSPNIGIEMTESFSAPNRKAQESMFERTITEALLADPMGRTTQVRNFRFTWEGGDSLFLTCDVLGTDGNSASIEVPITAN